MKRKAKVLEDYENNVALDRKRKRYNGTNDQINDIMWTWFQDASRRQVPISGPLLQETVRQMAEKFKNETFKASNGWLQSFIKRHNIVFGSMTGDRGDVDLSKVTDWKDRLKDLCVGYDKSDIFNMDETGLFFRDTSKKTFHVKGNIFIFFGSVRQFVTSQRELTREAPF